MSRALSVWWQGAVGDCRALGVVDFKSLAIKTWPTSRLSKSPFSTAVDLNRAYF